ncbi:MAG: bifunctional glutamate N-acetyltransferase/amino-acid acetyltransferase ArgJ [Deltaproteobacteria bacterium]|nr:bifunctional glutamate N-acetyltransferase/amino-acid acetyltransferase ArgJ [Deltaproteobacteria bacterium]
MKILKDKDYKVPGFLVSGTRCGIKKKEGAKDLAVIYSEVPASVAAVFTKNAVKAAPVLLDMERVKSGKGRAVVINSGNANACTGDDGLKKARAMSRGVAKALKVKEEMVYVSSTGVIGEPLPVDKIINAIPELVKNMREDGWKDVEAAIMTTDAFPKMVGVRTDIGGKDITIMGIAKGAGMIHPNMATMLCYIATDCFISPILLDKALRKAVDASFNSITVDGDTSTNDTVLALANGVAGNKPLTSRSMDMGKFQDAFNYVTKELAKMIVRDGEGATKVIEINVKGAAGKSDAKKAANAIGRSNLVKTAFFGNDPNWGRIAAAAGYSGARVIPERMDIYFNDLQVVKNGLCVGGDWEVKARNAMKGVEVKVTVDLNMGKGDATVWASDLTYEYVKINASYRS